MMQPVPCQPVDSSAHCFMFPNSQHTTLELCSMLSSCYGLPLQCIKQEEIERQLKAAAVQASAHILLLLLALLLESYLRLQHRRRQAAGYLAFYWRTRSLLPLATRVTALGQVLLLFHRCSSR